MQVRSDIGNLRMLKDLMGIPGIGPSLLTKTPGGHPDSQKVAECVLCYEDKYKCLQQVTILYQLTQSCFTNINDRVIPKLSSQ